MKKYLHFEYVFDKYHYGLRLDYYSDWKCFQMALFCFIITIHFGRDK